RSTSLLEMFEPVWWWACMQTGTARVSAVAKRTRAPLGWQLVRELNVGRGRWAQRTALAAALTGCGLAGFGHTRNASAQTQVDDARLAVAFSGPAECGPEDHLLQYTARSAG